MELKFPVVSNRFSLIVVTYITLGPGEPFESEIKVLYHDCIDFGIFMNWIETEVTLIQFRSKCELYGRREFIDD